jgi:hypothetical protein
VAPRLLVALTCSAKKVIAQDTGWIGGVLLIYLLTSYSLCKWIDKIGLLQIYIQHRL